VRYFVGIEMKQTDIKKLWGRSGNRCAFPDCNTELVASGSTADILGEMAHIIASSTGGPRGESDIPQEERDDYDNRILFCPTHHTLVDKNRTEWTVEELHKIKEEHENKVRKLHDQGRIEIRQIENERFLGQRKQEWENFHSPRAFSIISITPLEIVDDLIDPLENDFRDTFISLNLPRQISNNNNVNKYHTRPNESGILNEDLRIIGNGYGHRIQLYRNGHFEFLVCIDCICYTDEDNTNRGLNWTPFAEAVIEQVGGVLNIWNSGLPFNDGLLTVSVTHTSGLRLYLGMNYAREPVFGPSIECNILEFSTVINKKIRYENLIELILKRYANYFGFIIDSVYDEKRNITIPRSLE
jgi:hypothetical protein